MSSMILPDLRRLQFSDSDRSCVPLPDIWGTPLTAKPSTPAIGSATSSAMARSWNGAVENHQVDPPLDSPSSFKFSRYGIYNTTNSSVVDKPNPLRTPGPFSSSHLTSPPISPIRPITGLNRPSTSFNAANSPSPVCDFSPIPSMFQRSISAGSSPTSASAPANQRPANIWTSSYRAPTAAAAAATTTSTSTTPSTTTTTAAAAAVATPGNSSFSAYNYPLYHRSPFLSARPSVSSPVPLALGFPIESNAVDDTHFKPNYIPPYSSNELSLFQHRAAFDSSFHPVPTSAKRHTSPGTGQSHKRNVEIPVQNRVKGFSAASHHTKELNLDSPSLLPQTSSPDLSTSSSSTSVPALDAGSASSVSLISSSSSSASSPGSSASTGPTALWNSGSGRTRNYKRSGAGFKLTLNTDLYKTELCVPFMKSGGHCPYDDKCQFAHGEAELKQVDRPAKWRSKPCQNWVKLGSCSYNERCCFRHDV